MALGALYEGLAGALAALYLGACPYALQPYLEGRLRALR